MLELSMTLMGILVIPHFLIREQSNSVPHRIHLVLIFHQRLMM